MTCLSISKRAEIEARITKLESQLAIANETLDSAVGNEILEVIIPSISGYIFASISQSIATKIDSKTSFDNDFLLGSLISLMVTVMLQPIMFNTVLKTSAFSSFSFSGPTMTLGLNLINNFNIDELETVIAHELSHQKNKDVIKRALMQIIVAYLSINFLLKDLIQSYYFRLHERDADLMSASYTNKPLSLISALGKIHSLRPKIIQMISEIEEKLFWPILSHPTLEKRTEYLTKAAEKSVTT